MRTMKDSGIEWIGEIPQDWGISRIKNEFGFGKGLPITKENLVESGIPVINYGQIHAKYNSGVRIQSELLRFVSPDYIRTNPESLVHFGDLIVADTSEDLDGCGNSVYVDEEMQLFAGYHTIIQKSLQKKSNKYYAYLMKTDPWRSQIRSRVSGVKVFSISRKILSDAIIICPPVEEQHRIANYLDSKCAEIDSVIAETEKTIEEYKALKQSIITEAVTKGIRPNRTMKDSGIEWVKELPVEWETIPSKFLFRNSDERKHVHDEQMTASQQYGIISQTRYMELTGAKVGFANKGLEDWKHVEPYDFIISLRSFQGGLEMSETTGCITWHYIVLKSCKPIYCYYYR